MDLLDKIHNINKRWDLPNEESDDIEFSKFKTRILDITPNIDSHVDTTSQKLFCIALGKTYTGNNIQHELRNENDPPKFYKLLEIIFALDINDMFERPGGLIFSKKIFYNKVVEAFKFSNINVAITNKGNDIIIYSRGEKLLDNELVNPVISFLDTDSQKHFIDALKYYQKNTSADHIKSLEHLRRTIEEFLKYKLNNKKGLKENINDLGRRLKSLNSNNDIKNLVIQTLKSLDQLFNGNSKHTDGDIKEGENEFLIYQTALLVRYINELLK